MTSSSSKGRVPFPALATAALAVIFLIAGYIPLQAQTPLAVDCATGGAVTDPEDNPGLVEDCDTLLALSQDLAGTAVLDWSATTPIESWTGIALDGTPPRVVWLTLAGRSLTGSIPPQLGSLPGLVRITLERNQLTGSIPAQLGNLSQLKSLWLGWNKLTGAIPKELGDLSNLAHLRLSNNDLTGSIPSELGNLSKLQGLYLDDNGVTGSIPAELGDLSSLTTLDFRSMRLTGSIPSELGNLSKLTKLDLGYNQLTGSIPPELGDMSSLVEMSIFGNRLTGEIPADLGQILSLKEMALNSNQLSGAIPTELGNLSSLTELVIFGNRLTGVIPTELGNLSNLTRLALNGNDLTGVIPTELGNLSNLTQLGLQSNELTGVIPTELGNLSNLRYLRLEQNQLSGAIPVQLGSLSNLTFLGLDRNDLAGAIPSELASLTNLQSVYLSRNRLTGCIPQGLRDVRRHDLDALRIPDCEIQQNQQSSVTTLSGLNVDPGTLTPTFQSDVASYTATTDANEITVSPVSDHDATFEFLDANNAGIPDSNSGVDGHQVSLAGGQVLVRIKVTSQDGTAHRYYTVEVDAPEEDQVIPPGPPLITTVGTGIDTLTLGWSTPAQTGSAPVTAYDLRYIETAADESLDDKWTLVSSVWTSGSGPLSHELSGLSPETEYDLQVRALNGAEGPWSSTATASTAAAVQNTPPMFLQSDPITLTVAENTMVGMNIGSPVAATDTENDALVYTLGGADASSFYIVPGSGQVRASAVLDYETKSEYSVSVQVTDGKDDQGVADSVVDDTINVNVSVTNVDEPGYLVMSSVQPTLDKTLEAELKDPDGDLEELVWVWDRSTDQITWKAIPGAKSPSYAPVKDDLDQFLRVTVFYKDGQGPGKSVITPLFIAVEADEPPPASEIFDDVPEGIWYELAVSWMISHRITSGCSTMLFCPERNLTRQEFVAFLWRAAGRPTPLYTGSEAFSDVRQGVYADEAIGWAAFNGVTAGCTQGELGDPNWQFCPEHHITRGQMATLLYRHVEADYVGPITSFADVNPDRYFGTSVAWLTGFEVAPGCGTNLFCPERDATRAEAALFIHGVAVQPNMWGVGNTSFNPQPN